MYGQTNTIKLEDGKEVQGFKVSIPYPEKSAVVRLPTDAEVLSFYDTNLKNVKNKDEDNMQPYVDLFAAIRLDLGESFDEYECKYVIDNLLRAEATSCKKEGSAYRITLKTPFGEVANILRLPTLKELNLFHSALASRDAKGTRIATIGLFDKLVNGSEGYLGEVPVHHKTECSNQIYVAHAQFDPLNPNA